MAWPDDYFEVEWFGRTSPLADLERRVGMFHGYAGHVRRQRNADEQAGDRGDDQ